MITDPRPEDSSSPIYKSSATNDLVKRIRALVDRCMSKDGTEYYPISDSLQPAILDALMDAAMELSARSETGWISVKDRLPDIGERILAYVPKADRKVKELCRLIPYEGAREFFWDHYRGQNAHVQEAVTHWMPLPSEPGATPPAVTERGSIIRDELLKVASDLAANRTHSAEDRIANLLTFEAQTITDEGLSLLMEGVNGFGRVLVATSDQKAVSDWRKRCKAYLSKTITGGA